MWERNGLARMPRREQKDRKWMQKMQKWEPKKQVVEKRNE